MFFYWYLRQSWSLIFTWLLKFIEFQKSCSDFSHSNNFCSLFFINFFTFEDRRWSSFLIRRFWSLLFLFVSTSTSLFTPISRMLLMFLFFLLFFMMLIFISISTKGRTRSFLSTLWMFFIFLMLFVFFFFLFHLRWPTLTFSHSLIKYFLRYYFINVIKSFFLASKSLSRPKNHFHLKEVHIHFLNLSTH